MMYKCPRLNMAIQLCYHHIHLAFAGPHLYEANTKERNRFPSVEKLQEIDRICYLLIPDEDQTLLLMRVLLEQVKPKQQDLG